MTRSSRNSEILVKPPPHSFSLLDEAQFRSIFEDIHLGVVVTTEVGAVVMCNRAALDIVGLSQEQLLNKYSSHFQWRTLHEDGSPLPPEEHPIAKAINLKQPVTNQVFQLYRPLLHDWIWVSVSAKPQFSVDSMVRQVICTFSDITEQKRAEAALRESEDRYRDLVDHSQDLLCTHTLDGRLLSVNPAPARILGYEASELVGLPMRQLLAPEFRNQFNDYLATIRKQGEAKGLMAVMTRSGERRIWEYHNTLRTQGVVEPIVRGLAHDVTEQRRLDEAIRMLVQDVRSDSSVSFFSSMASHLAKCLGADFTIIGELVQQEKELVRTLAVCCHGRSSKNFTYELSNTPCERVVKESTHTYESGVAELFPKDTLLRQAGIEGYVGTPLYDSKGRALGIMLAAYTRRLHQSQFAETVLQLFSTRTAAEIERKRTEEQLKQLSERLHYSQDEERRRISRELHDSKAQKLDALTITLGAMKRRTRPLGAKVAAAMSECLTLADDCVRDLRTFAYLLHPPLLDEFGLHAALQSYIHGLRKRSRLTLNLHLDKKLEHTRLSKNLEFALFRIIQEGLTNVRLHSRSKSAYIDIRVRSDRDQVSLTLRDRGRGLPRRVLRAIKTGVPTLSGLGIAGMQERVVQLGGQFQLTSSTRGTRLNVVLPILQDNNS